MGMASFVDRLRDLLNDAMHFRGVWDTQTAVATPEVTEPVPPDVQMRAFADDLQKRVDAYGPLLDNIIKQLNELLEYATDPALQLVEEVLRLRIARDSLSTQLHHACKERDAFRADVKGMRSFVQQAHYAKNRAKFAAIELRAELETRITVLEHEVKSLKGELASKDRAHEKAINKLRTQHCTEIAQLQAAHTLEMNDLRRRAERAANRPIPTKDQSRREEFIELLSESPSPRVSTPSMPVRKGASNTPGKKR
jgi:uncharacterized small protein (DUF1192 family)